MIRTTTRSETDLLVALAAGTGVFKPLELEALREVLDDYHNAHDPAGHRALTLERDGQPIGFAYYAPTAMTDRAWHLYWIFVGKTSQARRTRPRPCSTTSRTTSSAPGAGCS